LLNAFDVVAVLPHAYRGMIGNESVFSVGLFRRVDCALDFSPMQNPNRFVSFHGLQHKAYSPSKVENRGCHGWKTEKCALRAHQQAKGAKG
jgi:hypothetical protein